MIGFFCYVMFTLSAAVSNFTASALIGCFEGECGRLSSSGYISFNNREDTSKLGIYDMLNVLCFAVLGIGGGLLGALFNTINVQLTKWRNKYLYQIDGVTSSFTQNKQMINNKFSLSASGLISPLESPSININTKNNKQSLDTTIGRPYTHKKRKRQRNKIIKYLNLNIDCEDEIKLKLQFIAMCEVLFINLFTISLMCMLPYIRNKCVKIDCQSGTNGNEHISECLTITKYGSFTCDKGHYNTLASLMISPKESLLSGLFYYQENDNEEWFDTIDLFIAFLAYFFISCITYGISIPSGLFIPLILIGSTFGHLSGIFFNEYLPNNDNFDVGTFSLLGSAAVLGGCTRMTISLTVIIVEISQDVYYLLPIMFVVIVAKWVGDRFNSSLYDSHVGLKSIPYLEPKLPKWFPTFIVAKDIMKKNVITLTKESKLTDVIDIFINDKHTKYHNAFPVVEKRHVLKRSRLPHRQEVEKVEKAEREAKYDKNDFEIETKDVFVGLILKSHIMAMIGKKRYSVFDELKNLPKLRKRQLFDPKWKTRKCIDKLNLNNLETKKVIEAESEELDYYLDFSPYMHLSPYVMLETTPVIRIYQLFRNMGLRHLVIVDRDHCVTGIITTRELSEDKLEHVVKNISTKLENDSHLFVHERLQFLMHQQQGSE